MRGVTHLAGGICAAAIIGNAYHVPYATLAAGVAVAGVAALVPDWINVAMPGINIRGAMGHRGFTHWILTAAITWLSVRVFSPSLASFWFWGFVSHLLLDVLTKRGALVFWPLPWQVSLLPIHEGGLFDKWLGAALIVIAVVVMVTEICPGLNVGRVG
jgi:inner membrane protein